MIYIGIDIGLNGGIAVLDGEGLVKPFVEPIPTRPSTVKGKEHRRLYDGPRLCAIFRSIRSVMSHAYRDSTKDPCFRVVMEAVNAFPKQSALTGMLLGRGLGGYEGICWMMGWEYELVHPAVWKSQMGLTRDKRRSLELARKVAPKLAPSFARMKDDGLAEALLLAEWRRRRDGNGS